MPEDPMKGPADHGATRLESDDDIRRALAARRKPVPGKPTATAEPEVLPDRPVLRPPLALLSILDDGRQEGEVVRLRADRTILGRLEGDVRLPHDLQMSARHAEIVRQKSGNGYRWRLVDLDSTNGTFVRIGSSVLQEGSEFLIGSGRFRFEGMREKPEEETDNPKPAAPSTQAWAGNPVRALVPSLVELSPSGPVNRHVLMLAEYWIGREAPACPIHRPDDLLVNPRHAHLYRDGKGLWHVENNRSLNGLWLRIREIILGSACQFRLGEQRFVFRIL